MKYILILNLKVDVIDKNLAIREAMNKMLNGDVNLQIKKWRDK